MAITIFASIDVGSFEVELSIYEIGTKNGIRCVDHLRHVIGMGSDTYNGGLVSTETVDELCGVLLDFKRIMEGYRVTGYRACATSALREAKNRMIILDQIRVRTGFEVSILSNAEQRYLTYGAIPIKADQTAKQMEEAFSIIVDVGFGSTQVTMYENNIIRHTQNLKLGALRMQATLAKFEAVGDLYSLSEELIDNELNSFWAYYELMDKDKKKPDKLCVIALGDCIRLFVAKLMHKPTNQFVPAKEFIETYKEVHRISANDLVLQYDVPEEYAEIIIPTAMIYYRFLIFTGADVLWLPGVNLCDGLATEYAIMQKIIPPTRDFSKDIIEAAKIIRKRYHGNEEHSDQMLLVADRLFDAMKKYHGLEKRSKLLLYLATILHDVGKFISMSNPGDCSYAIIKSTEILGLSNKEQIMLANIVRYNTADLPFSLVPDADLDEESYRMVIKLTAMLRIANVLDRSHRQKIKDLKISLKDNELVILIYAKQDFSLEKGLLLEKTPFFEQVFGIVPILKQKQK